MKSFSLFYKYYYYYLFVYSLFEIIIIKKTKTKKFFFKSFLYMILSFFLIFIPNKLKIDCQYQNIHVPYN